MARESLQIVSVKVVEAMHSVSSVFHPWAQVLLHAEYDYSMELRNAAFEIIFFGLFDAADGASERFGKIQREANSCGAEAALHYLDFASKLVDGVVDILSQFNVNETLWLREMRMQKVHGQLQRVHWGKITFPVASEKAVRKVALPAEEYWQRFRDFAYPGDEEQVANALRKRFLQHPSLFWELLDVVRNIDLMVKLQREMMTNQEPSVRWDFENGSYWDTAATRRANGPPLGNLARYRPAQAARLTKDPVFP
jgi:hypothetical protein